MVHEKIQKGSPNAVKWKLRSGNGNADLKYVTRIVLEFEDTSIQAIDSDVDKDVFDWSLGNGVLRSSFGEIDRLGVGRYPAVLRVFTPKHPAGHPWDHVLLEVVPG